MRNRRGWFCCGLLLSAVLSARLAADEFTYVDETGKKVVVQARLHGSAQGFQALERWDGQLQLVPTAAIVNREVTGDPPPLTLAGMEALVREKFGADLVKTDTRENTLVVLVLSSPLPKSSETQARAFLTKAAGFMGRVDDVFVKFGKSLKLPLHEPKFPLVLLIFESDDDFEKYAQEVTGGQGLSADNILGFYSLFTNWLAVRMSSCDSFEVPLHEAIHLQVYNRLLPRLADVPQWFNEGIATGFEGTGDKVNTNPTKISAHYAKQARQVPRSAAWTTVVENDASFSADVLAGDAYTLAWSMHWMLVTRHEEDYVKFVTDLARREPLVKPPSGQRLRTFEETFHVSVAELQAQFPEALEAGIRRQKVDLTEKNQVGRAARQQALCEYQIDAVVRDDLGGQLQTSGKIQNISTLRPMTFYITLVTGNGVYAEWLQTDVKPRGIVDLPPQVARKVIPNAPRGRADQFQIFVKSAAADSPTAQKWKSGQVPGPPVP